MSKARLILVVGPSGAGKDSLMDGARAALADDGAFHFARRAVTRPAMAGAEDHDSVTPRQFDEIQAAGGYLLWWRAHGLSYGIPAQADELRLRGITVIAGVSRAIITQARVDLTPVGIVVVTAPHQVLAARLAARGRESMEDVTARLKRADQPLPKGDDVRVIVNDGALVPAVDAFVAALRDLAGG